MIITRNGYEFEVDPKRFNLRFKGGKRVKTPPLPDPAPTPTDLDPAVAQKEQDRRRQKLRQSGRGGTILTEQTTANASGGGAATLLGRSTA